MSEKGNSCGYQIQRTGENVAELLDKIEGLGPATASLAGLMTAADKKKLDSLGILYNTTNYWNRQIGYVPKAGEIIIYSDYKTEYINGRPVNIPGIKIGSGNGYIQDLAFVDEANAELLAAHIADGMVHVTPAEKLFWNNKLNVTDFHEVIGESLIFNRD